VVSTGGDGEGEFRRVVNGKKKKNQGGGAGVRPRASASEIGGRGRSSNPGKVCDRGEGDRYGHCDDRTIGKIASLARTTMKWIVLKRCPGGATN